MIIKMRFLNRERIFILYTPGNPRHPTGCGCPEIKSGRDGLKTSLYEPARV